MGRGCTPLDCGWLRILDVLWLGFLGQLNVICSLNQHLFVLFFLLASPFSDTLFLSLLLLFVISFDSLFSLSSNHHSFVSR